ncbi:MAG: chemotaxis protein CheW [bacterium]
MKNLATLPNNNVLDNDENLYLYFQLGDNKYALNIWQMVEIIKLPLLDYPQKLANNVVGLLNYNKFTINILDLRFYLNIKVAPYSVSNQLLIVKTDETIFGLIIDKVEDIIYLEQSKIEYFPCAGDTKIIEFMYKKEHETISIINLCAVEEVIKQGVPLSDIDIPSLFPRDDDSRYKLMQRNHALFEKSNASLGTNIFAQDRFISFSLNENIYCINVEYVKEVLKNFLITPIPCNLDYVAGVIALRGDFITVVDTKTLLGINENASSIDSMGSKNSLIIIEVPDYQIGFLVDELFSIINIAEDLIKKKSNNQNKYTLSEVILEDKFYTILDIKNILSDEKFFIEDN